MTTKGAITKQKIIDASAELFNRKGFGTTSVNDLLNATGVTKGNLYFHFPSKDDVGFEVLRQEHASFMSFLDDALRGETPAECLDNFFQQAIGMHRSKGFVGGCLFGNTALEASDASPAYASLTAETFVAWQEKLRVVLEKAQVSNQIRCDSTPQELAEFIVAVLEGGIMQSRLFKDEGPMRRCVKILRKTLDLSTNQIRLNSVETA